MILNASDRQRTARSGTRRALAGEPVVPREALLVRLVRAVVLSLAAAVGLWPVALPAGVIAAVVGALIGAFLGDRLARSRLRLPGLWLTGLGLGLVGHALGSMAVDLWLAAQLLGPIGALALGDACRWLGYSLGLIAALRATAARYRTLGVLEVALAASSFVAALAQHRDGAIHRPTELADFVFTRGGDPAVWILGAGAAGTLALATLLLSRRRLWRAGLDLLGAAVLVLLVFGLVRAVGGPQPRGKNGLGLTGKSSAQEQKEREERLQRAKARGESGGSGQSSSQNRQLDDLPFRDDYSNSDQAPVAVVLLHDDFSPPTGVYYFRQSVFSQFNGHRLVASTRDDVDRDVLADYPTHGSQPVEVKAPPPVEGRRQIRTTIALLADHLRPFALEAPYRLESMVNPDSTRFRRAYEAVSRAFTLGVRDLLGRRTPPARFSPEVKAHYTAYPDDPRYGKLAQEILSRLRQDYREDPYARALAVKLWLDKNGIYTRKSSHATADDPTADFLFGDKQGYCVHFAHAATYLMRSLGLPARVAAGYAVTEENRGRSSAIMIRGGDAHAWPEVWLEGLGWVIVDVSPEKTLDPPNPRADQDLQSLLGELVRKQRPLPTPAQLARQLALLNALRATAEAAGVATLLMLLMLYVTKLWRQAAPGILPALGRRDLRLRSRLAYRAALDRLAGLGSLRDRGETREHFAARQAAELPSLTELTSVQQAAALGSRRIERLEGPTTDLPRDLLRKLRRELRKTRPAWRRALGWLDPWSWLRSR